MADSIAIASVTASMPAASPQRASNPAPVVSATTQARAAGAGSTLTLNNPRVAEQVDAYLKANSLDMKFSVDDETGQTIVRIYNSSSGELVRQIPTEDLVRLARALHDGQKQTLAIEV